MVETKKEDCCLASLRESVRAQGEIVRELKSKNTDPNVIKHALSQLKARKKLLEDKEIELSPVDVKFDRTRMEDLLKQKFFYDQSFSIYGGVQGLYDYGPMGCAMKTNLLNAWRRHFIMEDHLLEVDCSMLTPHPVLQASGHVERFTDLMVKDAVTGECYRADHLIKNYLEERLSKKDCSAKDAEDINRILVQLDNYKADEMEEIIVRYKMKAPITKNDLTKPHTFNLMFETMIGPTGQIKGYLRPETAQGIFVNFQRLLAFNHGRIPFGAAQIGSAFRNEISPRSGLIRVREFTMAEIEYFVDPNDKSCRKFDQVKDLNLFLYSACDQMDGKSAREVTVGDAVKQGVIANETLGYFMARIHLFLLSVGVDAKRLRFRQHLSNEMAHYACDCWDAECQTSYGWIECVGCADRSCYDLVQHIKATGARLSAEKSLPEAKMVKYCRCMPVKNTIGKAFKTDAKQLMDHLSALSLEDAAEVKTKLESDSAATLSVNGKDYKVDTSMVTISEGESKVFVEEIIPNVIEPSFGIGRILYAVFEHSYREREGDEKRSYLSVPPLIAPYKCSLLPLSNQPDFTPFIRQLSDQLTQLGLSHRIDESSGSIGRRYARTDQIAIPYGVTIDFDTLNKKPASATLRERDTMQQIRVPMTELPNLMLELSNGVRDWDSAKSSYPIFEQQETGCEANEQATPSIAPAVTPAQVCSKAPHAKQPKSSAQSSCQPAAVTWTPALASLINKVGEFNVFGLVGGDDYVLSKTTTTTQVVQQKPSAKPICKDLSRPTPPSSQHHGLFIGGPNQSIIPANKPVNNDNMKVSVKREPMVDPSSVKMEPQWSSTKVAVVNQDNAKLTSAKPKKEYNGLFIGGKPDASISNINAQSKQPVNNKTEKGKAAKPTVQATVVNKPAVAAARVDWMSVVSSLRDHAPFPEALDPVSVCALALCSSKPISSNNQAPVKDVNKSDLPPSYREAVEVPLNSTLPSEVPRVPVKNGDHSSSVKTMVAEDSSKKPDASVDWISVVSTLREKSPLPETLDSISVCALAPGSSRPISSIDQAPVKDVTKSDPTSSSKQAVEVPLNSTLSSAVAKVPVKNDDQLSSVKTTVAEDSSKKPAEPSLVVPPPVKTEASTSKPIEDAAADAVEVKVSGNKKKRRRQIKKKTQ